MTSDFDKAGDEFPEPGMEEPQLPEFVLLVRDNAAGGVEVVGLTQPEAGVEGSPSHIIGRWMAVNFDELAQRAALDYKRSKAPTVMVEPEKTILLAN